MENTDDICNWNSFIDNFGAFCSDFWIFEVWKYLNQVWFFLLRFYYSKQKYYETEKILLKIAQINNKDSDELYEETHFSMENSQSEKNIIAESEENKEQTAFEPKKDLTYFDLFRISYIRRRAICLSLVMLYLYIVYNGITFGLADLGGDIYLNSVISAGSELFAYIFSSKLNNSTLIGKYNRFSN